MPRASKGCHYRTCRHFEIAHATRKRGRSTSRQVTHFDLDRRGADPLADSLVLVEEIIEDGQRAARRSADTQLADHFGRIDGQGPGLLRNQHVLPQQRGIVDGSVHIFPVEFQVVDRDGLFAPEAVEGRELDVFEAGNVGAGVDFEGGGDGFPFDHVGLVQRQAQENILIGNRPCDSRIVVAGLRLALLPLLILLGAVSTLRLALLLTGHYFNLQGRRGYALLVDGGTTLRTNHLTYDRNRSVAYYTQWGHGENGVRILDSRNGLYNAETKEFYIHDDVRLRDTSSRTGPFEITHPGIGREDDAECLVERDDARPFQFERLGGTRQGAEQEQQCKDAFHSVSTNFSPSVWISAGRPSLS